MSQFFVHEKVIVDLSTVKHIEFTPKLTMFTFHDHRQLSVDVNLQADLAGYLNLSGLTYMKR